MSLVPEEIMQMHWTQATASSNLMNLEVLRGRVCFAMFAVLTHCKRERDFQILWKTFD